jgi:signal transduction histidine kinase
MYLSVGAVGLRIDFFGIGVPYGQRESMRGLTGRLRVVLWVLLLPLSVAGRTDSVALQLRQRLAEARTTGDRIAANYALAVHLAETDSVASERSFSAAYRMALEAGDLVGQAKYYFYRARRRYNLGRFAESEALCRKSLALLVRTRDTITTLHAIGILFNAMDYQMKDIGLEKGYLDFFERTVGWEDRGERAALVARGFIYGSLANHYTLRDPERSRQAFLRQYDCYRNLGNPELLVSFHSSYSHFNLYLKDYGEAIRHARTAVDLCRQMKREEAFDFILLSVSLAEMLITQGRFQEAQEIFNDVVGASTRMRQDLIEMGQKDHQLALARAMHEADRNRQIGYVVATALLMGMFFLFLLRHLRLQALRREVQLKQEMAMDLHDEMGTAITQNIMHLQGILASAASPDPRLRQILVNSVQMNASFRDAVWSADRRTDDLVDILDRIVEAGHKALEGSRFTLQVSKAPNLPRRSMNANEKRNIMLIVREALHNVIRHSDGDRVEVSVFSEAGRLVIRILDNGAPGRFDPDKYGMGLHSMRQRAEKMRADIGIGPAPGGFAVRLAL